LARDGEWCSVEAHWQSSRMGLSAERKGRTGNSPALNYLNDPLETITPIISEPVANPTECRSARHMCEIVRIAARDRDAGMVGGCKCTGRSDSDAATQSAVLSHSPWGSPGQLSVNAIWV